MGKSQELNIEKYGTGTLWQKKKKCLNHCFLKYRYRYQGNNILNVLHDPVRKELLRYFYQSRLRKFS